jgi:Carboxypeptidase regulatory-like domain
MKDFDSKMSFTGSKGEFRVEHLLPGSWQVIAMPARGNESAAPTDDGKEVSDAAASLFQKMKMTVATINEGEETHVVLGAPPKDPVDVHGTVTHAGEPFGGAMVMFVAEGKDALKSMKTGKVAKDGTYAVRLDAAGHYSVNVQLGFGGMGQQSTVEFSEEIPEVKDHKLDLALPTARISGIVRGPDGEPAAGARVSLHPETPVATGTMWGGQYHEGVTDADGKFDVQFLRAGTYALAVGGSAFGGMLGGDATLGREIRGGLRLSDGEWMRDADFRLKKPGTLNVTVLDSNGQPVPEASVFARDAGGRLVDALSMSTTDASGRAKYKGLGPGTYTIVARKDLLTSTDSGHVKLDEGGSGEVQVALQPGTIVIVTCMGAESKPIRASISVQDESGREVGAMISIGEAMKMFSENGFSTLERRIGPVPQGKYTVRATDPDGKTVTKQVNLTGQAERKLTIHFD